MMKKNVKIGQKGFTLIEVVLSIAILALVSIPLINYFTDSLKHSALSAQKQKATLAAQDMIEFIKGQDQIMKPQDTAGGLQYAITGEMRNKLNVASVDASLTDQSAYDPVNGSGTLIYTLTDTSDDTISGFDIKVTLHTDTAASAISRPIIYGIDDDKNIVAAEHAEENEAISYFVARSIAASMAAGSGHYVDVGDGSTDPVTPPAPAAGSTEPMDEDEVKDNLKRKIYVEVSQETVAGLGGSYYVVRVYYVYTCEGVLGAAGDDEFVTNDLINTAIEELEGIYLMFNKLTEDEDEIIIKWNAPAPTNRPEFRLICQDLISGEGTEDDPLIMTVVDNYEVKLRMLGFGIWPPDTGGTAYKPEIRTNIIDNDSLKVTLVETDTGSTDLIRKPLTDSSDMPVRLFDITVDVYKKGDLAASKPCLVEMTTTKTE
ncbi:MAG: prepilin-type N-terminal cleavage/methylation domain-containing protein [Lachnospiraceae bacterium]|jgi:prepilin-type N-terminal cleavage/methylation domain-containing protein|nr:prepilin-type N-terminal cleavage/methylation domain-containing protein [Lachnospiraceae bacterium]